MTSEAEDAAREASGRRQFGDDMAPTAVGQIYGAVIRDGTRAVQVRCLRISPDDVHEAMIRRGYSQGAYEVVPVDPDGL